MNEVVIASRRERAGRDYILASYDDIHLLFPGHEVRSIEMIADLEPPFPEGDGMYFFRRGEEMCPVFALDREFGILLTMPAQRQHFVLLTSEAGDFGIACDQTGMLRGTDTPLVPLPECMQGPFSPVQGVRLIADAVGFYCPSSRLAASLIPERE